MLLMGSKASRRACLYNDLALHHSMNLGALATLSTP